jgi:hypothetical protein
VYAGLLGLAVNLTVVGAAQAAVRLVDLPARRRALM